MLFRSIERKTLETGGKQNYFGYRDLINWIGTYNLNLDNRIVFGSDLELDAARYNGDYAPSANNWKKIFMDKFADENIHSIYFDYQFRPFENLYTTFGLRSDEHTSSGRKSSGRTTFLIKLDEKSRIRSSYGSGIRFPSLYDLHFADGNTNASGGGTYQNDGYLGLTVEDLKPERANSFDIGYAKDLSELNLKLDINYFYIEQKNPLNSDSRNNWKLQNTMGLNTSKGIELELGLKPQNSKVGFDLAYTFTDSYDSNTCSNDITSSRGCNIKSNKLGSAKVRVPRNILNTTFYYNPSSFFKNTIKFKFVDERRDFGDVNNDFKDIILDDYITVDFSSQFSLFPNYDLFFLAKNLFDTNYEQSNGYSSLGRSFFLGIKNVY